MTGCANDAAVENRMDIEVHTDVDEDANVNEDPIVEQSSLEDYKEVSLLNDRLTIMVPDEAEKQNVNNYGIMGPDEDEEAVTSYLFGNEYDQTFVSVKAFEQYNYCSGDLEKDVSVMIDSINSSYPKPISFLTSEVISRDGISYVSFRPETLDADMFNLVGGAMVLAPDNALILVIVNADKNVMANPDACHEMTEKMIGSLKGGIRLLDVSERTLSMIGYTIQIEEGYAAKLDRGADFDVWRICKMVPFNSIQSSFGIYFGDHPSPPQKSDVTKTVSDEILGKKVTWDLYLAEADQFNNGCYAEVYIEAKETGWPGFINIFAYPASEDDWESIRGMARSLQESD
jgi:hypothetical protein